MTHPSPVIGSSAFADHLSNKKVERDLAPQQVPWHVSAAGLDRYLSFGKLEDKSLRGVVSTMSPYSVSRILGAITKLEGEMGVDYEKLVDSMPVVVAHALLLQSPVLNKLFPGLTDLSKFEDYMNRIKTRARLKELLDTLDEPSPEEMRDILLFLRSLSSRLKAGLQIANAQIKPSGGPPEKLSDPVEVNALVDEIVERHKMTGDSEFLIQRDIARERGVSLKTVQRRYKEEMERRKSVFEWLAKRNNQQV
jgi:hypothetical protein